MAEFVAMPLWTDAYLGDTTHLSTLEHGAYLLLLITAWRTRDGKLPNNDKLLAKYSRLSDAQWKRIKPVLEPFFKVTSSNWMQGRLMDERVAVKQKSKRQSDKAKTRWLKTNKTPKPRHTPGNAEPMPPLPVTRNPLLVVDARVKIPRHVEIGEEISKLTGWDQSPSWKGDYGRIEQWLANGWDTGKDIIPTVKQLMGKRSSPPGGLKYFEQAIANAHAARLTPLPQGNPNAAVKQNNPGAYSKSRHAREVLAEAYAESHGSGDIENFNGLSLAKL